MVDVVQPVEHPGQGMSAVRVRPSTTLSLAIIVGPGEAFELERCLKSCAGPLFDEIVVTVTSPDQKVVEVALAYADKAPSFGWKKDFAAARNFCFSRCESDYIMWLDADDIITPDNYQKLLALKPNLGEAEVHFIWYNYDHHPDGRPKLPHPRERIIKRGIGIDWVYPIHECLNIWGHSVSKHPEIAIDHYRTKPHGARNLEMLAEACAKPDAAPRMVFYYAKELLDTADWEKGEPLGRKIVDEDIVMGDEAAVICRRLAYGYLLLGNLYQCERYCYKGISASGRYAEFYCFLGDIAMQRKDDTQAIRYFEMAMACSGQDNNNGPWDSFYDEVPARNLYLLYLNRGDAKRALMYNKFAIQGDPDKKVTRTDRDLIWARIQTDDLLPTLEIKPVVAWLVPGLDYNNPSIRVRRINVCQRLVERGVDSFIVHDYYAQPIEKTLEEIRDANVVVLTQFGDVDHEIATRLRARGVRLCFDHCELIGPYPLQFETFALADALVCCSTALGEISKTHHGMTNAVVIKDAWE